MGLRRVVVFVLPFCVAACGLDADLVDIEPTFAPLSKPQVHMPASLDELEGCDGVIPGQYIVQHAVPGVDDIAQRYGVGERLQMRALGQTVVHGVTSAQLDALRSDPDVVDVYEDHIACASAPGGGGGPPGGGSAAEVLPAGVDRVGADEITNRGAGVTVCVVDSGMDYNHADLAPNYVGGFDFVNNDSDPIDDNGHGTHVAGTIGAVDNETGVIGVAPQASLLVAKVLNRRGSGAFSGITAGVNYCVNNGADVINMSLGGTFDDPALEAALESARDAGVTIVVAAGNDGVSLDSSPHYPANYDGTVITVAAAWIEEADRAMGTQVSYPTFSNHGSPVDLTAPGVQVLSTKKGGGTTSMNGTSMASPHVAGGAALYIAANPGASPAQVESALESNTENVNNVSVIPQELLNVRGF